MANNIEMLNADLENTARENAELAKENFGTNTELTPEEEKWAKEQQGMQHAVITEETPTGGKVSTPIAEYAAPLDDRIKEIQTKMDTAEKIKAINQGDVKKTVEDLKAESRASAIRAFRELSVTEDTETISDDDIVAMNDEAIKAVQEYLHVSKLDADLISKKFSRLPLSVICSILPPKFVELYAKESEIKANNIKAKERIITSLAYLTVTGPELDYLNDYIDNEHRLMALSQQLMKCQVDFMTLLHSTGKISEVVAKALSLDPPADDIWAKVIDDPRRIHNEFAQRAVVMGEYKTAYEAILAEHKPVDDEALREALTKEWKEKSYAATEYDYENKIKKEHDFHDQAVALIKEQIDESDAKMRVYLSVTKLETMRKLWDVLVTRMKGDKRMDYKNLLREGANAIDRIRRSKQNVVFPVYDAKLAKRPADLLKLFLATYPTAISTYNAIIRKVLLEHPGEETSGIDAIELPGIEDTVVYRYFSLMVVILYGRLMKTLSDKSDNKFDAIELDSYFQLLCKLSNDVYVMTDVWNLMKDFVEYAIVHYPEPKTGRR